MNELSIVIQNKKVKLPVFDKQGIGSGKFIIITAGMDGDEYAGIQAAYELMDIYSNKSFPGRIVILPIINMQGFEIATSLNPLDNKFPKHIYPGNKYGTSSEQLLYFLSEKYISKADIWIDLHGGALTEKLMPFVWTWQTGNKEIDTFTKNVLSVLKSDITVFDAVKWNKVQSLAEENVAYILLESGQQGQRNAKDIKRHIDWVNKIIRVVYRDKKTIAKTNAYTRVSYYKASYEGLWYPLVKIGNVIKGQILGEVISRVGTKLETIKSSEQGKVLWYRTSLNAKKGEILVAITY